MEKIKSKIFAYEVKFKEKRKRTFLPVEQLYDMLMDLSSKNYDRNCDENSKLRKVNELLVSFDVCNKLNKKLSEVTYNYIDFFTGKEIKENIPTRDEKGNEDSYNLPDNLNFCFKTHGRFIFKKIDDSWKCILFFERKHNSLALSMFESYLKEIFDDKTIIFDQINRSEDIIEKLNYIEDCQEIYLNNSPIKFDEYKDDGLGDMLEAKENNKPLIAAKLVFKGKDLDGSNPVQKIKSLFSAKTNNKKFNKENFSEFIKITHLSIFGKRIDEPTYRTINIFSDIFLFEIEVILGENRLIDENLVFKEFNSETGGILVQMFDLINVDD